MQAKPPTTTMADVDHIVEHLATHFRGKPVTPEAVLWPNAEDLVLRFHALTSPIDWSLYSAESPLRLLDVGCGPGFLLDYLNEIGVVDCISYVGVDLNPDVLDAARAHWPDREFLLRDVRQQPFELGAFDVAIFCGVFTCRFTLDQTSMTRLMHDTLESVWRSVTGLLAFNVMSKHVDWERDDLFHYSVDDAISFSRDRLCSRNVRILHDYGLYEYSCVIFRCPNVKNEPVPSRWRVAGRTPDGPAKEPVTGFVS